MSEIYLFRRCFLTEQSVRFTATGLFIIAKVILVVEFQLSHLFLFLPRCSILLNSGNFQDLLPD